MWIIWMTRKSTYLSAILLKLRIKWLNGYRVKLGEADVDANQRNLERESEMVDERKFWGGGTRNRKVWPHCSQIWFQKKKRWQPVGLKIRVAIERQKWNKGKEQGTKLQRNRKNKRLKGQTRKFNHCLRQLIRGYKPRTLCFCLLSLHRSSSHY